MRWRRSLQLITTWTTLWDLRIGRRSRRWRRSLQLITTRTTPGSLAVCWRMCIWRRSRGHLAIGAWRAFRNLQVASQFHRIGGDVLSICLKAGLNLFVLPLFPGVRFPTLPRWRRFIQYILASLLNAFRRIATPLASPWEFTIRCVINRVFCFDDRRLDSIQTLTDSLHGRRISLMFAYNTASLVKSRLRTRALPLVHKAPHLTARFRNDYVPNMIREIQKLCRRITDAVFIQIDPTGTFYRLSPVLATIRFNSHVPPPRMLFDNVEPNRTPLIFNRVACRCHQISQFGRHRRKVIVRRDIAWNGCYVPSRILS
ncbi:hypothetical protein BN978_01876 [Mycolicibacterium mageritense DSM 44476 = CIP 104973]|nr:hypothetical protein BN978_01876 [Mycolicibacterium mageritense DSM 44476 = CIP 104973]